MRRGSLLTLMALGMGVWISLFYIEIAPMENNVSLSVLILQLSGSSWRFPLNASMDGLLDFVLRLIPCFAFQAVVGVWIYRNYCTASVYVFSRLPGRLGWYGASVGRIAGAAAGYEAIFLLSAVATAAFRFEVIWDALGWKLLAWHFVLYTLWIYAATLLVNLTAIWKGSSAAYAAVVGGQLLLTALFYPLREDPVNYALTAARAAILRWDPVACLVLSWQTGAWPWTIDLESPYPGLWLETSVLILLAFAMAFTILGAAIVKRHDLLISDLETGGN